MKYLIHLPGLRPAYLLGHDRGTLSLESRSRATAYADATEIARTVGGLMVPVDGAPKSVLGPPLTSTNST
jgi:hypothetical protein